MDFLNYLTNEALSKRFNDKIQSSRAVGSDGVSAECFAKNLDAEIEVIQRKVANFNYRFSPFKEKLILKKKTSPPRAVYIPTVRDRLLLNALNAYVSEQFCEDLAPHNKPIQQTIREVKKNINSHKFDAFLKLDVENFFPSLDHKILMEKLASRITDKTAISLLRKVLNRSNKGIAQGLSIASLMASIYLNKLDQEYKKRSNLKYFRFVDDILILCHSEDAKSIAAEISQEMKHLELKLHALEVGEKSKIGQLSHDKVSYLGFEFQKDKITVREASVEKLRKRIRMVFTEVLSEYSDKDKDCLDELKRRINLKITGCLYDGKSYGWLFFFSQINDLNLLYHLDWFVRKTFDSFDLSYDTDNVKSFVKTYYKMKSINPDKLDANTYIPSFESSIKVWVIDYIKNPNKSKQEKKLLISDVQDMLMDLENDVEIYS